MFTRATRLEGDLPSGGRVHTEIEIIVDSAHTDELLDGLQGLEEVISLSVTQEASIKPPG